MQSNALSLLLTNQSLKVMSNIQEIWKDVIGFEGSYQVSSLGNVKTSLRRPRIKKQSLNKYGYPVTMLYRNNKSKQYKIHRLMAIAFIPNPDRKLQVNHKDGNRSNNLLSNLEWVTHSENVRHGFLMGRKLYNSKPVNQYSKSLEFIRQFESRGKAASEIGTSTSLINSCICGRIKSAGGFVWKNA